MSDMIRILLLKIRRKIERERNIWPLEFLQRICHQEKFFAPCVLLVKIEAKSPEAGISRKPKLFLGTQKSEKVKSIQMVFFMTQRK